MKKFSIIFALLLVAGVALTGCSSKTSTTSSTNTDTPPSPPTSETIPSDTAE